MKKIFIITIIAFLFLGCGSDVGKPCFVKEIPLEKRAEAAKYVKDLMATIQVQTRNDDEDWDDFIEAAHNSAFILYSETLEGVNIETEKGWTECDCSKARAKAPLVQTVKGE